MSSYPKTRHKPVPRPEQVRLINECRKSGLSDARWCEEHDIAISTFYSWVQRNKDQALQNITNSLQSNQSSRLSADKISLVKIVPDASPMTNILPITDDYRASRIELEFNGVTIRIPKDYDPLGLLALLRVLRELQ